MTGDAKLTGGELEQLERLAGIGAWSWELRTGEIVVSDGLREIFGFGPEPATFAIDSFLDRLHPDDREGVQAVLDQQRREAAPIRARGRIVRTDGEERVVEGQSEAVLAGDGSVWGRRGVIQDITERVRVEQQQEAGYAVTRALAEAETVAEAIEGALSALAETSGWEAAGLWLVDPDTGVLRTQGLWHVPSLDFGEFVEKSKELEFEIGYGLPGHAWQSRRPVWRDIVAEDDLEGYPRRALARRAGISGVLAFPLLSGGEVTGVIDLWRRSSVKPPEDLIGLLASFGNQIGQFLERKRAENELFEHRRLLAETQQLARIGSWEWKPGSETVVSTEQFPTMLGIAPGAAGPALADVFATLHGDDRKPLRAALERCGREGREFGYLTTRLAMPVGETRFVQWFGEPVRGDDGSLIVRGTTQDITREHELRSELATRARQQAVVAAFGSEALLAPDVDSLIANGVQTVAETLGIQLAAVMELLDGGNEVLLRAGTGWAPGMVGRFTVPSGSSSHAGYVLERSEPVVSEDLDEETRFEFPEQLREHGVVSCAAVVIASEGGSFGALGAYASERRRFSPDDVSFLQGIANVLAAAFGAERAGELERQLQQAQRLDSVGKLAGGIAHDFNNLLAVILNYADFALETADAENVRDEIEEIKRAAERAADLTRQLLLFSRREVTSAEVTEVGETLSGMETILRRTLGEHLRLNLRLAPGLWPVQLAGGLLEQVVLNLALNARDAMPEGGGIVIAAENVSSERLRSPDGSSGRGQVRVSVTDGGAGMSDDVLDRAFEPFFTTKPEGEGTGLGLATVYGIVQRAGGEVEVDSQLDGGTMVAVSIPAAIVEDAEPEVAERSESKPPGGSETVLLVEDEDAVRRLTRRILEDAGYTVFDAAGPDAAVELWNERSSEIDLLLTDVVMPGRSGIRLREELALKRPDLNVVYMSGYAADVVTNRGKPAPRGTFLRKPFLSGELLEAVRTALAGDSRAG